MSNKSYEKCKRYVVRGMLGLVGGSALLLVCKLSDIPEFWVTLSTIAGSCIVLYGNGCIIYGLLISAGDRESE